MAGRVPGLSSIRKHLTLTQVSVITGIVASIVTIAAFFGLAGRDDGDGGAPQPATAVAARPIAGAVYSGQTEQGETIYFRVYSDGRTIRDLTVPLQGDCSDGGPFTSTYRQGEATTFLITGSMLSGSSTIRGRRGEIVGGIFRIDARFEDAGRRATGSVSEHAEIKDGSTCDTPRIGFTVTAEEG